jgi:sulfide:quinone oxidoreductase
LQEKIRDESVEVLLIGQGFRHYFQPGNLDMAFKGAAPDNYNKGELDLLRSGVRFIPDPAARINLENREITTAGGSLYGYEYLVLATGADPDPGMVPGLRDGSVNFHLGQASSQRVWGAVREFKKGKVGVLIAGVPHKAPTSPDEALFLLDELFRHKGVRDDVELTLLTPHPGAYPAEKVSNVVGHLLEERGIKVMPSFKVDAVDPEAKTVHAVDGDEYGYDLLIAIPPHRGASVVRESGIGDPDGWVPTDRNTMRVRGHDDAFAIGDATDIPIPKSGVAAYLQSKAVAMTIFSEVEGVPVEYRYNGRIDCPMAVGGSRAILVSATYMSPPAEQAPSMIKYAMMRGFASLYWSALSGRWEWLMNAYFGKTSEPTGIGAVAAGT